jgi:hypothetical protein
MQGLCLNRILSKYASEPIKETLNNRETFLQTLQEKIEAVINRSNYSTLADIEERLLELQTVAYEAGQL